MNRKKEIKQKIKLLKKEGFSSRYNLMGGMANDLKKILMQNEELLAILDVDGSISTANRLRKYLVLTNERIIYIRRGMWIGAILFYFFRKTESIRVSDITDIKAITSYEYKEKENMIPGQLKIIYQNQEKEYKYTFHKVALKMVDIVNSKKLL